VVQQASSQVKAWLEDNGAGGDGGVIGASNNLDICNVLVPEDANGLASLLSYMYMSLPYIYIHEVYRYLTQLLLLNHTPTSRAALPSSRCLQWDLQLICDHAS